MNSPAQMSLKLAPVDAVFEIPPERAYVTLYSQLANNSIFTGYIAAKPVRNYVARVPQPLKGGQLFEYDIITTSDDHLLNIKSVPFIPVFINRPQGRIVKAIDGVLCPGLFDYSNIDDGDLVPRF